jgi:hypothetical protein
LKLANESVTPKKEVKSKKIEVKDDDEEHEEEDDEDDEFEQALAKIKSLKASKKASEKASEIKSTMATEELDKKLKRAEEENRLASQKKKEKQE